MKEMTLDSWISIIEYFHKLYNPIFVITGGEPLVRDDIFEITAHLKKVRARWGMVTNGFNLTKEAVEMLIDNGLESLTLSVDGLEKNHTYIRRHKKAWSRVDNALDIIGKSSVQIKDVVTCVYPGNINELNKIGDYLVDKGINSWRLFRIFPKGAAKRNSSLLLDFDQSNKLIKWIESNRKHYINRGVNLSFSCEGYLPIEIDNKVRPQPYFCRAGINIASILADGTVTGCNNNGSDYYQGNLIKDDFEHIWETRFQEFRNRDWLKTGKCKECNDWKYCKGSSIHLRDKSVDGPNFCYVHNIN